MVTKFQAALKRLTMGRWFSKREKAMATAASFGLLPLEQRQLMSVTLADGVLTVIGTPGNDHIVVSLVAGQPKLLQVTGAGGTAPVSVSSVTEIAVYGLAGNDFIQISEVNGPILIDAVLKGGAGSDTLAGGSGNDTLVGGRGADELSGGPGANLLLGGAGQDTLLGQAGNDGSDTLAGGIGANAISDDYGADNVISSVLGHDQVDTGGAIAATPYIEYSALVAPNVNTPAPVPTAYTPQQVRTAYGFGSLSNTLFSNRGDGMTIAIVDAFDSTTVRADLAAFSATYGLPAPSAANFQQVYASGTQPITNPDWDGEIALDVEWAHAIAPNAKIILVEAATNLTADLYAAVGVAANLLLASPAGGGVVSMSFGSPEDPSLTAEDSIFANPAYASTISFIAASGDVGGLVSYPASSDFVTAVGGTSLPLNAAGNVVPGQVESAWGDGIAGDPGGGGGQSVIEPLPGYQSKVTIGGFPIFGNRVTPDVAFLADPNTGVSIFDSSPDPNGNTGWAQIGGTSLACPLFAATVTLSNQERAKFAIRLIGGNLNQAIYNLGVDQNTYFNDIKTGSNGFPALTGFDEATGWGSPKPSSFINGLEGQFQGATPPGFVDTTIAFSATYYQPNSTGLATSFLTSSFLGTGTVMGVGSSLNMSMVANGNGDDGVEQQNGALTMVTVFGLNVANGVVTGAGQAGGGFGPLGGTIGFLVNLFFTGTATPQANGTVKISGSFYTTVAPPVQDPLTGEYIPGPAITRLVGNELEGTFTTSF